MAEFVIVKDLKHPNIVDHKYIMKKYDPITQRYECHLITEYVEGLDMNAFIQHQGATVPVSIHQV